MKKLIGLMLATVVGSVVLGVLALPAIAADSNRGGVVVSEGDAAPCNGGSCGGMINEDPDGRGMDCDGGNCGGSVCQGTDCGSCDGGNCGGSISGPGTEPDADKKLVADDKKHAAAPKSLPRTGNTLPLAATVALGVGMLLAGAFFTFAANPSTKLAMAALAYRPKRRL